MITQRTKVQLAIFLVITLLGVSYVGARYAKLTRLFVSDQYEVTVHLAQSGGIFSGGEVSYRGVAIGRVGKLTLTSNGVDADLMIDNKYDKIPADSLAAVGNLSAVGEQYVDLQPQSDKAPYLKNDSQIAVADTSTPISTETLLGNLANLVGSVNRDSLRTTVEELGKAFAGTGPDLQRLIDTSTSFIDTANDNFDTTTALIKDSNVVLQTQIDSSSDIANFSAQLAKFSNVLAGANPDLIKLISTGSAASNQLRDFLQTYGVDLGDLINNLITTGQIVVKNLPGIKQILVLYPYVLEGGFTVVSKSADTGLYDAHFGLILTNQPICHQGYEGTVQRSPQDGSDTPMNTNARCTEPAAVSNARGAQNLGDNRAGASYKSPTVASYDPDTKKLTWGDPTKTVAPALQSTDTVAPATLGGESWKWLFLQPMTSGQG